jgi:hypothetical protein
MGIRYSRVKYKNKEHKLKDSEVNNVVSLTRMSKSEIIKWHKGKHFCLFTDLSFTN